MSNGTKSIFSDILNYPKNAFAEESHFDFTEEDLHDAKFILADGTDETKKVMGYIENPITCNRCKHCIEKQNPYVDRSWFLECRYSNLTSFDVQANATCNKAEQR